MNITDIQQMQKDLKNDLIYSINPYHLEKIVLTNRML